MRDVELADVTQRPSELNQTSGLSRYVVEPIEDRQCFLCQLFFFRTSLFSSVVSLPPEDPSVCLCRPRTSTLERRNQDPDLSPDPSRARECEQGVVCILNHF